MSQPASGSTTARTEWSKVLDRSNDWKKSLDQLFKIYWRAPFWYLIRSWKCTREDAIDYLYQFYRSILAEETLETNARDRARLRSFLKVKLRDWIILDLRKKSGSKNFDESLGINAAAAGDDPGWSSLSPEEEFDRVWAKSLLAGALDELEASLKREGKEKMFRAFWLCTIAQPPMTYADCAASLQSVVNQVQNYVFRVRADLLRIIHPRLLDTVEHEKEAVDEIHSMRRMFIR